MALIPSNQEDSLSALHLDALTARLAETERLLAERTDALDALHRREQRLQEAQRVARIGSWEFDPAANKITWSAEMFRLTGFNPAGGEPDYQTLMTHYHPDDVPRHDAAVLQALDDGLPYELDIRIVCPEGVMRWGHAMGQAMRDETGQVVRLFGTMMDITERKQADEENARLAAIVESSHDAVLGTTLDGTLVSWNKGAERLYGYSEAEIIGQHLSVLAPPEERGFGAAVIQALKRGEVRENVEVRRRRKDGTWIDLVLTFSPICNPAGDMVGVAVIGRDVSAQRQAEDAVRRSEARLAEAQRIAQIGSWEADAATGKITLSDEMYRLLEISPDAPVTHELVVSRYHPDDLKTYHAAMAQSQADIVPFGIDIRVLRAGGGVRWCHAVGEPVFDGEGRAIRWAGTMMDITERVLVEERFRVLFEHSSEAHFFVGEEGIIDCNGAALQMLRCNDKAELLALHPMRLSPTYQPDGRLSAEKGLEMEAAAHAHGSHRFDWTHIRCDGTKFPTEIILTPVTLGGQPALLAVWHDLTERKEAEQRIRDYAVILEFQKRELEQVNRELCDLATTDGLTGLKNHRAFQEHLASECGTALRRRTPLSLLLLDVDHFKQYNDAYGHPAGDAVLKQVARLLTQTTRPGDFVARYGGEEFVVILPQTSQANAMQAAERCRASVEAAAWSCRAVTLSVGVATLSLDNPDSDSLIAAADQALYAAKYNGRNQVVSAGHLFLQDPPSPANLVVLSA
jgi:diguanylate cyclase (GGDEF)-like protein/PAS domain S-box-containing protein